MTRPLPQNIDVERGLLGIIMESNDALFDVVGIVSKADFVEPLHGEWFTLMRDLIESNRPAKPLTLLSDTGQDANIGGISTSEYLALLLRDAPPKDAARTFARQIRDLAMRRRLIQTSMKIIDEAFDAPPTIGAHEIEARYHAAASALFGLGNEMGVQSFGDVGDELLKDIETAARREEPLGIEIGLKGVQDLVGALMPGRLIVLAGGAGAGKTALVQQIAEHVAKRDPVLFISAEMAAKELAARHFVAKTKVSTDAIERGMIGGDEYDRLAGVVKEAKKLKLWVDASTAPTVGSIRGKALRHQRKHGLSLLIVDHMYELSRDPKKGEFDAIRDNMQNVKRIAQDLGLAVILLCQLKHSFAGLDKPREPNDGDISGGGAVPQVADIVVLIHREEYQLGRRKPAEDSKEYGEWLGRMDKCRGLAKLILGKRRAGKGFGSATLAFDAATQRFSDRIPNSEAPPVDQFPF